MAKVATPTTRPPESIAATTPAIAEVVRECAEMANYAIVESRVVLFDLAEVSPVLLFPSSAGVIARYYLPVWVDEDIYELELRARASFTAPGNTVRINVFDGMTLVATGATLSQATPEGTVIWQPGARTGRRQYTIQFERILGTDPVTFVFAKCMAAVQLATNIANHDP